MTVTVRKFLQIFSSFSLQSIGPCPSPSVSRKPGPLSLAWKTFYTFLYSTFLSLFCFLFYKHNMPNYLIMPLKVWFPIFINLVALFWPSSRFSMPLLKWGVQNWRQYFKCCLSHAKFNGYFTSYKLNATLFKITLTLSPEALFCLILFNMWSTMDFCSSNMITLTLYY